MFYLIEYTPNLKAALLRCETMDVWVGRKGESMARCSYCNNEIPCFSNLIYVSWRLWSEGEYSSKNSSCKCNYELWLISPSRLLLIVMPPLAVYLSFIMFYNSSPIFRIILFITIYVLLYYFFWKYFAKFRKQ